MSTPVVLDETVLPPNALSALEIVQRNVLANFAKDLPASLALPSRWRLANLIVNQRSPVRVFQENPLP
jgi:hypothetical protein